jgi:hypothetical protein
MTEGKLIKGRDLEPLRKPFEDLKESRFLLLRDLSKGEDEPTNAREGTATEELEKGAFDPVGGFSTIFKENDGVAKIGSVRGSAEGGEDAQAPTAELSHPLSRIDYATRWAQRILPGKLP